jgi:hypothetical protein
MALLMVPKHSCRNSQQTRGQLGASRVDHLDGPEGRPYYGVPFNDAITGLYEHAAAAVVEYDVLPQLEAGANMAQAGNHGIEHEIGKTIRPAVQGKLHIEGSFREWQLPLYYHSLGWQ